MAFPEPSLWDYLLVYPPILPLETSNPTNRWIVPWHNLWHSGIMITDRRRARNHPPTRRVLLPGESFTPMRRAVIAPLCFLVPALVVVLSLARRTLLRW